MLYVVVKNNKELVWHVGEKLNLHGHEIDDVCEVQADCDELKWIYDRFIDLPKVNHRHVVRWFGALAKFIVANLVAS